ncbi:MAG TPA: flagellar motor switch protein FliG [Rhodopila sp.]|nr:flagellar motor switch protein FliG [Rhodopila sp.]
MAKLPGNPLDSQLSGVKKASILMLAMGEENASKFFSMMHDEEIKLLSANMAQLGMVQADTVEQLCAEFVETFEASPGIMGSFEHTENLLSKVMPKDRVNQIMEEIRGPAGRTMWDKLGNVNEEILANYLKNEYPQTVAVVLSMLKPDHAARVLTQMSDSFAVEVILRMLKMESVQKEVLDRVERILRVEFMSNLARASRQDSHRMLANIFNNFDRRTEVRFMTSLEEKNRESAEKIKAQMFTFVDLLRLTPSGIQVLLRNIDKEQLPIALKGAQPEIRALFLQSLSERASRMLTDEIANLGPVKVRDIEAAQSAIANVAKELAASGEIELSSDSDDRVVE